MTHTSLQARCSVILRRRRECRPTQAPDSSRAWWAFVKLAPPRTRTGHKQRSARASRFTEIGMLRLCWPVPDSLLRFKHDLLRLHLVEEVVPLDRLRQRHDLVRHESVVVSSGPVTMPLFTTHPSLSWCFFSDSSAWGKTLRTGHLPICTRKFLLYASFPFLYDTHSVLSQTRWGVTHHGISALCTPTLEITPHGRSKS